MKTLTCTNCGQQFERPANWKKSKRPFCSLSCYRSWEKSSNFVTEKKPKNRLCDVPGCGRIHFGKGFCRQHYIKNFVTRETIKNGYSIVKECANCGMVFRTDRIVAKYCSRRCCAIHQKKPFIIKKGYKKILMPLHTRADKKGYVFEHIVVAEKTLNRPLAYKEEVHHIDGNKENNVAGNLVVCHNHAEHMLYHQRMPSCSKE